MKQEMYISKHSKELSINFSYLKQPLPHTVYYFLKL